MATLSTCLEKHVTHENDKNLALRSAKELVDGGMPAPKAAVRAVRETIGIIEDQRENFLAEIEAKHQVKLERPERMPAMPEPKPEQKPSKPPSKPEAKPQPEAKQKPSKPRKPREKVRDKEFGATNKLTTRQDLDNALAKMREKLGTLNAGIDPELFKAGMTATAFVIEGGIRRFGQYAEAMIELLGERIRPYLRIFYNAVRDDESFPLEGMDSYQQVEEWIKADPGTEEKPFAGNLIDEFYRELVDGTAPQDNRALKGRIATFKGAEPRPSDIKQAQEAFEAALSMRARDLATSGRPHRDIYTALLRLYENQPILGAATSTSKLLRAYSTPAPIAYLASRMAGVSHETSVYEPTAGNAMLLLQANPKLVQANELDANRVANLRHLGFQPTQADALAHKPEKAAIVLANPPFAGLGRSESVDGYKISKLDHLISIRALEAMDNDGNAVLLIAANKQEGAEAEADRIFLNWLYSHYGVADHFEIDGDLYRRQGAGWPLRVLKIQGRRETPAKMFAPDPQSIERINDWSALYERAERSLVGDVVPNHGGGAVQTGTDTEAPTRDQDTPTGEGTPQSDAEAPDTAGEGSRPDEPRSESPAEPGALPRPRPGDDVGADHDVGRGRRAPGPGELGRRVDEDKARRDAQETARELHARRVPERAVGQYQVEYRPASTGEAEGALIPVNMATPMREGMAEIADTVGDLKTYVMSKLGYTSEVELEQYFSGLQIDGIAAAIYNIEHGGAVIIADQTGIGKGRQAAALLRYAERTGRIPVFVTAKADLFTDIYGDMKDIGYTDVNPFLMNKQASVTDIILDKEGLSEERILFKEPDRKKSSKLRDMRENGTLPPGHTHLFMTYSQVANPSVQASQRGALEAIAPKALFVLDEAHQASGNSNRGEFMRNILEASGRAVYLSATYAKRADNMPIYFLTSMSKALPMSELVDAIEAGGVALQAVISNMLTQANQLFRRERSYDGINISRVDDLDNQELHEEMSDAVTERLRAIVHADELFNDLQVKEMHKMARAEGKRIEGKNSKAGVEHTKFSSVVHNFIRQMMLSVKAETAVQEAVAALKRNEKPVIAVENTMGSHLARYVEEKSIGVGETMEGYDYRTFLEFALMRTLRVRVTDPQGNNREEQLDLDELVPQVREAYDEALDLISELELDIPVSPIDYMRHRLREAGYSSNEITGRQDRINYQDNTLERRDKNEMDRVRARLDFNQGRLDVLILNVAGSTGISLHASEKAEVTDKRKRLMLIAQPALDINTFMQMLGRINRTGQLTVNEKGESVLPEYKILTLAIPGEFRPAAVLQRKMKSLNANVSSNTESDVSTEALDFLNKYGNRIVKEYLDENKDIAQFLSYNPEANDLAEKVTGRIAILPVDMQKAFYDEVEPMYRSFIEHLDRIGQNDLKIDVLDLDARKVSEEELTRGRDETNIFGQPSTLGRYSIKMQGKPPTWAEVTEEVKKQLGEYTAQGYVDLIKDAKDANFEVFSNKLQVRLSKAMKAARDATTEKQQKIAQARIEHIKEEIVNARRAQAQFNDRLDQYYQPGSTAELTIAGDKYYATVTHIEDRAKPGVGNPYANSKTLVHFMVNGPVRHVSLSMGMLHGESGAFEREVSRMVNRERAYEQAVSADNRELRYIVTGNLLAAYSEISGGQIVSFTGEGEVRQGILMPRSFDPTKDVRGDVELLTAPAVSSYLIDNQDNTNVARFGVGARDGSIRLLPREGKFVVRTPSSMARGARWFLDNEIRQVLVTEENPEGNFFKVGSMMEAVIDEGQLEQLIPVILARNSLYVPQSMGELAAKHNKDAEAYIDFELAPVEGFYSELTRQTEAIRQAANSPRGWKQIITRNFPQKGVTLEEIAWSGVLEWLDGQTGKVSKDDLLTYLKDQEVSLQEAAYGGPVRAGARRFTQGERDILRHLLGRVDFLGFNNAQEAMQAILAHPDWQARWPVDDFVRGDELVELANLYRTGHAFREPSYAEYQAPGPAKGYRELVITYPGLQENYQSGHFPEGNIIAHVRFNEREDSEGRKTLFLEELQSDWHQAGRKSGYRKRKDTDELFAEVRKYVGPDVDRADLSPRALSEAGAPDALVTRWGEYIKTFLGGVVPEAPFKKTWPLVLFKRMIRYAAENGFDQIAWTPGEVQEERYNLAKYVDSIVYSVSREAPFTGTLSGTKDNNQIFSKSGITREDLPQYIGQEATKKLLEGSYRSGNFDVHTLDRAGLQIVSPGKRGFYDRQLKNQINKYVKKFGAQIEVTQVPSEYEQAKLPFPQDAFDLVETLERMDEPLPEPEQTFQDVWSVPVTDSMREAAGKGQPLFVADNKGASPRGMAAADIAAVADRVYQKEGISSPITIVNSEADLPQNIQNAILQRGAAGKVRALHLRGRVYVVAERMRGAKDAEQSIIHELVHAGNQRRFGLELDAAMRDLYRRLGGREGVERIAEQYGFKDRLALYKDASEARLANEVMAFVGQTRAMETLPGRIRIAIKEFIGKLRDILRRWNLLETGEMSEADLLFEISEALRNVQQAQAEISVVEEGAPTPFTALMRDERDKILFQLGEEQDESSIWANRPPEESDGFVQAVRDWAGGVKGEGIGREVSETYNWWDRFIGTLDNLARRNPDSPVPQFFHTAKAMRMDQDEFFAQTKTAVDALNRLSKEQQKRLKKALLEGTLAIRETGMGTVWSDEHLAEHFNLNEDARRSYFEIRGYFDEMKDRHRDRLLERAGLEYSSDGLRMVGEELTIEEMEQDLAFAKRELAETPLTESRERAAREADIKRLENKLRKNARRIALGERILEDFNTLRGYFPLMRFGQHTISVRRNDETQELAHFEQAESKAAMNRAAGKLRRLYPREQYTVTTGRLERFTGESMISDYRLLSMLREYSDMAKTIEGMQLLDDAEQAMLQEFAEHSFRKRQIHRKGIPGYSENMGRVIASYGWSASNYLSKMRFIPRLQQLRRDTDKHKYPQIREHMARQIEYMRGGAEGAAGEEYAAFKSLTFALYMGLNIKSAVVNLTQVPMVLYPYLAGKYSDARAVAAITRAQKAALRPANTGDKRLDELLAWAEKEGLTMDMYLSDLIGMARGKGLAQARMAHKSMQAITFLFSHAERFNRRVSAAAEYYANPDRSLEELKVALEQTIRTTQFDYGKHNRGRIFRSWMAVPMQFQQFTVNFLQFLNPATHGWGVTARAMGMLWLGAGLMGTPGADDLRSFIEYMVQKLFGRHLDLEFEARKVIVDATREYFGSQDARAFADAVLRGHGAYMSGTIAGSLSMSSLIPGFSELFDVAAAKGLREGLAEGLLQATGAGPGLIVRALKGVDEYVKSGDPWRLAERGPIPVAAQNILKAMRIHREGVDRDYAGRVQIAYRPDLVDTLMQGLSFQPSERTRLYNIKRTQLRESNFVKNSHAEMLTQLAIGYAERDMRKIRDARSAIARWNRYMPFKWRLSEQKIRRSLKQRVKRFDITHTTGQEPILKQLRWPQRAEQARYFQ